MKTVFVSFFNQSLETFLVLVEMLHLEPFICHISLVLYFGKNHFSQLLFR
ncbi:hypothetical protein JHK87_013035 [Glycine soja]|nr:hypothetical protein JHK87_013035 [Glycine soja]